MTLSNCGITKIEGLENKQTLKTLNLQLNKITKIEGLENVPNLINLNLSNNQIADVIPLSVNTLLKNLNLKGNKEIDGNRSNYTGERLVALNKIGEILDRDGTINIDIDKLGLFTNYRKINLSNQNLTTLEQLEGLTELTSLDLSYNKITLEDEKSQEILRSMSNLQTLHIHQNKLKDMTAINSLKKLKSLNIIEAGDNINLKEIEDIISNLDTLYISTDSLKTILNCDVSKITRLNVSDSHIKEIPDLSKFTYLTSLSLNTNPNITDLSSISKLTNLQKLMLYNVNLHGRMIDFSKLTSLTTVDLRNNTLWTEDLENLKALKNRTNLKIDLGNNSIIDASALLVLDTSCKIDLRNNVNLTQSSKDALKARFGNNVTF